MSESGTKSLLVLDLPDLGSLCCVNLFFPKSYDEGELRNKQVKACRELLVLHSDAIASPVLGCNGCITVIMTVSFYRRGFIHAFAHKHDLQFSAPQRVFPAILQTCLSYAITARLAPRYNKAGQFLISGQDFLSESGKLGAVALELSVTESQLCVCVEAKTVRLPPARIQDFDFPCAVVKDFLCNDDAVLETATPNNWFHILPSMKKGQLIRISRRIPEESPFQSYTDIQKHWKSMYGYQLPSGREEDAVYCSMYFQSIGEKLFTYPLCCIRTHPVLCFPRTDQQVALRAFRSDLQAVLQSLWDDPLQPNWKPWFSSSHPLAPAAQCNEDLSVKVGTDAGGSTLLIQLPNRFLQQHHSDSTAKQTEKRKRGSSHLETKERNSSHLAAQPSSSATSVALTRELSAPPRPKYVPIFKSAAKRVNAAEIPVQNQPEIQNQSSIIKPRSSICVTAYKPSTELSSKVSRRSAPARITLPLK